MQSNSAENTAEVMQLDGKPSKGCKPLKIELMEVIALWKRENISILHTQHTA